MIAIEKAEIGRWYRTPKKFRIRLVGPGEHPGQFRVETESGRSFVMEAGSSLSPDEDTAASKPVDNGLMVRIGEAVKAKDAPALRAALQEVVDAELNTVLSHHPVLWVIGAVNQERKRRAGEADPALAFGEDAHHEDRPITCPECGEQAAARRSALGGGKWVVVTHAGQGAPVCPGAGRAVEVATGGVPEPASKATERLVQVRDLDTVEAVTAYRAELEERSALTKGVGAELDAQETYLHEGDDTVVKAKGGDPIAIGLVASWGWIPSTALDVRPGVRRAFAAAATWAEGETKRIADEREAAIARDLVAQRRAEAVTGVTDDARVDRALDADEPDPEIRARVDALRSGVRGAREAARIEIDPAVVERAIEEERAGDARPTILTILEARAAKLRGETRRNVKARTEPEPEASPEPEAPVVVREGKPAPSFAVPPDPDAWTAAREAKIRTAGGKARLAGMDLDDCPFLAPDSWARAAWTAGWIDEDEEVAKLADRIVDAEPVPTIDRIREQGGNAHQLGMLRDENPYQRIDERAAWWAGWDAQEPAEGPDEPKAAEAPKVAPEPLRAAPRRAEEYPVGTEFRIVPKPDGDEDLWASSPGGPPRWIGSASDPELRDLAAQIRRALLAQRPGPVTPAAAPASASGRGLQQLFSDLAAALAPMKAAGIRVAITIDTAGDGSDA